MDPRQQWIDDLARRQDNIDPIRRIPNGAQFQGSLIKGNLRLNLFQRIAAIFLGTVGLVFGCFLLVRSIGAIRSRDFSDPLLPAALLIPLGLWFAWRVMKNAWLNDAKRNRSEQ